MAKAKSVFTMILFFALLLGAIIVPIIIMSEKEVEEESFPEMQKIKVTERYLDDANNNAKTRKSLENDYYFKKFATSPNYNYANIKKAVDTKTGVQYSYIEDGYLSSMIVNYIYNYQLTNTDPLASINYNTGYFCLTPIRVKESLEELYFAQISLNEFIQYIPDYTDYATAENGNICFNFDKVSKMNDNEILLGIKKLSVSDQNNITADLYLYKFYSGGSEKEKRLMKTAKAYIDKKNYSSAADIVRNNLNGTVEHKKIVFRINSRRKYFEYQLVYSAKID